MMPEPYLICDGKFYIQPFTNTQSPETRLFGDKWDAPLISTPELGLETIQYFNLSDRKDFEYAVALSPASAHHFKHGRIHALYPKNTEGNYTYRFDTMVSAYVHVDGSWILFGTAKAFYLKDESLYKFENSKGASCLIRRDLRARARLDSRITIEAYNFNDKRRVAKQVASCLGIPLKKLLRVYAAGLADKTATERLFKKEWKFFEPDWFVKFVLPYVDMVYGDVEWSRWHHEFQIMSVVDDEAKNYDLDFDIFGAGSTAEPVPVNAGLSYVPEGTVGTVDGEVIAVDLTACLFLAFELLIGKRLIAVDFVDKEFAPNFANVWRGLGLNIGQNYCHPVVQDHVLFGYYKYGIRVVVFIGHVPKDYVPTVNYDLLEAQFLEKDDYGYPAPVPAVVLERNLTREYKARDPKFKRVAQTREASVEEHARMTRSLSHVAWRGSPGGFIKPSNDTGNRRRDGSVRSQRGRGQNRKRGKPPRFEVKKTYE
jgi:hypothetical protein